MTLSVLYICLLVLVDAALNGDEQRRNFATISKQYKDDPAFYDDANPGVVIDHAPIRAAAPLQMPIKRVSSLRRRRHSRLGKHHATSSHSSVHHTLPLFNA
ncbi:unnamed protein product [Toxocara canis]|uniref:Uncharacterized protein n=1 Tax=Toxocara canis TaxID=6265 RepID=A0A183V6E6_TOXCA|nr:unnamed protein product [Toxocara canis]